ncbi:MAG: cyclase family protein [Deltaproteobacteria bacterium]
MKIYDISVPLSIDTPVYPGDPQIVLKPFLSIQKGDSANVSILSLSTHSGTHIDAPQHMDDGGATVDQIPLSTLIGRTLVVEIGGAKLIGRKELERLPIKGEDRLLLKTDNSQLWNQAVFSDGYASLSEDGAAYLIEIGIRLIGIDYLSIESFSGNGNTHKELLSQMTVILEGLDLSGVPAGIYELICLPLKIRGGDGAPARAILRQLDEKPRDKEE